MRIAIYGAGGLGAYYGARLVEAGHDVCFIARGEHLAAMRRNGLRVNSVDKDLHVAKPEATDDPAECGPVDLVIVAVKTWQVPEVAAAMAPLMGTETVVLPFLNGVEAADELGAVVGAGNVLGGLSRVFSLIEAPGVIKHFKPGAFVAFGELDGRSTPRLARVLDVFQGAGIEAQIESDIRTELWKKLLMVSSWAGIGALTDSPIGVVRAQAETRAMVDTSMLEGIAVGRARGYTIADDFKAYLWDFYENTPAEASASMMRDILAGKPSELHAWNGAIVRFGKEVGVPTPLHGMVVDLLTVRERRARGEL